MMTLQHLIYALLMWLLFPIIHGDNSGFDFYIKDWTAAGSMSANNSHQIIGYSIDPLTFYIFGGENGYNYDEYMYNPQNQSYQFVQKLDNAYVSPSQSYCTFVLPNQTSLIFFDSGLDLYEGDAKDFYVLNIQDQKINHIGESYQKPYAIYSECFATDGQRYIYLIGGKGGMSYGIMIFDVITYKWIIGPNTIIYPVIGAGCVYINDKLYVFGGGTQYIQQLSFTPNNVNYWTLVNANLTESIGWATAIYPVKDMSTMDYYKSNTIFIFAKQFCNKFNYKTHAIMNCTKLPANFAYGAGIYAFVENQYRFYWFGGGTYGLDEGSTRIQYALLERNNVSDNNTCYVCSWTANSGLNTLDLTYFSNITITKTSGSNENIFYRYTPCCNTLSCNTKNEMVDLFNSKNDVCDRYLAIWNNTAQVQVFYDINSKSWEFVYTNGEKCNGFESLLNIIWKCNPNIQSYNVTVANNVATCQHQIVIDSNFACN
eukprot:168830_1